MESGLRMTVDLMFLVCVLGSVDRMKSTAFLFSPLTETEPLTATNISSVVSCTRNDIQRAIESAAVAQKEYYRSTTGPQRGILLRKWYDLIVANVDDCKSLDDVSCLLRLPVAKYQIVATVLCLENGKTYAEAKGEILYAASFILWFSEEASRTYGDTIPFLTLNTAVLT